MSAAKRLVGWALFVTPPVAFGAVSFVSGELGVVIAIGLITGAAAVGVMAIMHHGWRMIHDGRRT